MGWRQRSAREMAMGLIKNAPAAKYPEALAGYLNALYYFNASTLPRSYSRSTETDMVQTAVHMAIASLKTRLRRAHGAGGPSLHARGSRRAHRATLRYEAEQGSRRR